VRVTGSRRGNRDELASGSLSEPEAPLNIVAVDEQVRHQAGLLDCGPPHHQTARGEVFGLDKMRFFPTLGEGLDELSGSPVDTAPNLEYLAADGVNQRRSGGDHFRIRFHCCKQGQESPRLDPDITVQQPDQLGAIDPGRLPLERGTGPH
jgi:hypothetical protein